MSEQGWAEKVALVIYDKWCEDGECKLSDIVKALLEAEARGYERGLLEGSIRGSKRMYASKTKGFGSHKTGG